MAKCYSIHYFLDVLLPQALSSMNVRSYGDGPEGHAVLQVAHANHGDAYSKSCNLKDVMKLQLGPDMMVEKIYDLHDS